MRCSGLGCRRSNNGSFAKIDSERFVVGDGEIVDADVVGSMFDSVLADVRYDGVGTDDGDDRAAVGGEELGVTAEDEFRAFV